MDQIKSLRQVMQPLIDVLLACRQKAGQRRRRRHQPSLHTEMRKSLLELLLAILVLVTTTGQALVITTVNRTEVQTGSSHRISGSRSGGSAGIITGYKNTSSAATTTSGHLIASHFLPYVKSSESSSSSDRVTRNASPAPGQRSLCPATRAQRTEETGDEEEADVTDGRHVDEGRVSCSCYEFEEGCLSSVRTQMWRG